MSHPEIATWELTNKLEALKKEYPKLRRYRLKINRRLRSTAGRCHYSKGLIEIAGWHLNSSPRKEIVNTLLHEIAHALAGHGHGHDRVWKEWCLKVGARPKRCHQLKTPSQRNAKFNVMCPTHGKIGTRHRSYPKGRRYYHKGCGETTFLVNRETGRRDVRKDTSPSRRWKIGGVKKAAQGPVKKKETAPKKKETPKGEGQIYRVARVLNPDTANYVTVPVKTDGTMQKRFAHLPDAEHWVTVRATSWAEATEKAREQGLTDGPAR